MRRLTTMLLLLAPAGWSIATPAPDRAGYDKVVQPFLEAYCLDCHDDATRKGKLSLEGIDIDLVEGDHFEIWRMIRDQIFFHEMPPKKKEQPEAKEREEVLAWIRQELLKTQQPGAVTHEKLQLPQFGNYVDHEALFGERRSHVTPAPPRIWRLRPDIYNATLPRHGERVTGLANGLSQADGPVLKDYASIYFIDEASTTPLLGNARKIAEGMVGPHAKDKNLKRLLSDEGAPDKEAVETAIRSGFIKVLGRNPTGDELTRFAEFHAKSTAIGGYQAAGRALVTAILMQPEVLYRQELGDGTSDAHGRTRLSPRETVTQVKASDGVVIARIHNTLTESGHETRMTQGEKEQHKRGTLTSQQYHGSILGLPLATLAEPAGDGTARFDAALRRCCPPALARLLARDLRRGLSL